jgi:tRNA A-37 threonylcarbamoyl transferase component Bud32
VGRGTAQGLSVETNIHPGTEFIGYRLEQLIGQGGMGVVYRAYDRRLKRAVALKFIAPELALDEQFRERFLRETELAAAFEHPNAVPIHDAGEVDGRLYLAMRYVEGNDLATLLRSEGPLEPGRGVLICAQVARALDAAHASGLVHRDVKPSNVLLDAGEHVYLADFGLTRRRADENVPPGGARSLGTPAYAAPEQLEGGPVDGRADLYSLGCLLFECLTGAPPFASESRLAVAWAHLEEEPASASSRNPALPAAVDEVLHKALAKDPANRQASCADLITAMELALGLRAARRARRRTALLAATAVLVAGLAAVATAVVSRSGEDASRPLLYGRPNTVVRIDPSTNAVTQVVAVGAEPDEVAVHGDRIWVYSATDHYRSRVASFRSGTTSARVTSAPVLPADLGPYAGPVLAADAGGAWLVGRMFGRRGERSDRPALVRFRSGDGEPLVYRLDREPSAVAAAYGAVWVAVRRGRDSQLLRIDPATGDTRRRLSFPHTAPIDSLAVGLGYVWAVSSSGRRLYRVDPSRARIAAVDVSGDRIPRPFVARGLVWAGLSVYEPDALVEVACCSPERAGSTGGFGSPWTFDNASGTVVRWRDDREIERSIRVAALPPSLGGPCMTAIAAGAGAVWVAMTASSFEESCSSR